MILHCKKYEKPLRNVRQFASQPLKTLKVHPNPVKICQIILCIILYFLCSFNPRSVIQQLLPKYKKGVEWGFLKACILCKCFSPSPFSCLLLEECKKGGTRVLLPLLLQQQEEKCIFFTYGIECKILLLLSPWKDLNHKRRRGGRRFYCSQMTNVCRGEVPHCLLSYHVWEHCFAISFHIHFTL